VKKRKKVKEEKNMFSMMLFGDQQMIISPFFPQFLGKERRFIIIYLQGEAQ
jgi:hypothetical protein